MKLHKLLMVVVIVAAVIQPGREVALAHPPSLTAKDFTDLREQWVRELRSKQLDPIIMRYASNAVFLPPATRIVGQAAIREHFKMIISTFNSDLSLHSTDTLQSGDLAYDSGDYQETMEQISDGSKHQYKGNYLVIYQRQKDGKWLIVQHMWN
jgi:ketosteroid isomerase-like protein